MPESFYGNLTTPQQPTFVFDKVYTSRYDLLQHQDDGVMVGRYALVTYGAAETILAYYNPNTQRFYQTYTQNTQVSPQFDNELTPRTGVVYENLLAGAWKLRYYYYTEEGYHRCSMEEGQGFAPEGLNPLDPLYSFLDNVFQDVSHVLEPANNSVFIKLYSKETGYYYREIASLNEYLPQVECIIDAPIGGGYINLNNNERLRAPYLLKSGLTYELHMTQTPIYQIGSIQEYNREGFSKAQVCKKELVSNSTLHPGFTYQPAHYKAYPYNARDVNVGTSTSSAPGAQPDVYNIQTNFIDIGNVISDVWDVVYGNGENVDVLTTTTSGDFISHTRARDTVINSTPETAAREDRGGEDFDCLRGIANTMIRLVGYEGYEQDRNENGELHYKNLQMEDTYLPAGQAMPEGWTRVYDLTTVRGLLKKGMEVSDQLDELDATLVDARDKLDAIQALLGDEDESNVDLNTIYGLFHSLSQDIAEIQNIVGQPTDRLVEGEEATIWGIYKTLSEMDITKLRLLIGADELEQDQEPIMTRLAALEEWKEQMEQLWIPVEVTTNNGTEIVLSTDHKVVIANTLTAMDADNKVRGAMWAR